MWSSKYIAFERLDRFWWSGWENLELGYILTFLEQNSCQIQTLFLCVRQYELFVWKINIKMLSILTLTVVYQLFFYSHIRDWLDSLSFPSILLLMLCSDLLLFRLFAFLSLRINCDQSSYVKLENYSYFF